ncbi:MAG: fibrobacter succinogenes major paralogous domain-containing protein [Dysgonamonadaceae bacterium]|jgi:uncharacterized protein (TIGR02145 family)|nr:fibrobacter succinogenes major paralogous domain-containing protein [Dysgonamonadaceae bacterium]
MNKYFFILIALVILSATGAKAQVTIGSTANPKATLDVVKTAGDVPDGVLIPRFTKEELNAEKDKYTSEQIGAMVFVTDETGTVIDGYSNQIGCKGIYYWQGTWVGARPCTVETTYIKVSNQPNAFTFYELGTENGGSTAVPTPLNFSVSSNTSGNIIYQWYIITGSNINVRIAEACDLNSTGGKGGEGYNQADFSPNILRGTTKNANYNGFYRYFCRATNSAGDFVESNVVEVAVGCGAKNMQGEWLSFLCFNLGATELSIVGQRDNSITFNNNNLSDGRHKYKTGEETVYGDLFQWGRIGDGHQKRKGTDGKYSASNSNYPGGDVPPEDIVALENQVNYSGIDATSFKSGNLVNSTSQRYPDNQIKLYNESLTPDIPATSGKTAYNVYGKFIYGSTEGNWAYHLSTSTKDLLWRSGRYAANDPCAKIKSTYTGALPIDATTSNDDYETYYPAENLTTGVTGANTNWRLPNQEEWGSIFKGGAISGSNSNALANTWKWNSTKGRGYEIQPDGATTTLFLPAAGSRLNGNGGLYNQGSLGHYWSSTFAGTNAYYLYFYSGYVNPANITSRGYGFSLRCIRNN